MKIFTLTPIKELLNHRLWEKCNYHGIAIVREKDESCARQYVAVFFNIDPLNKEPKFISPWLEPKLVSCEPFSGELYPQEGDPGILHPSSFRDA